MIKACKAVKDNIKETVSADKKSTFEINELIDDNFPISSHVRKKFNTISGYLKKKFDKEVVDEKVIDQLFDKGVPVAGKVNQLFKTREERETAKIIFKMHALFGGNRTLLNTYVGNKDTMGEIALAGITGSNVKSRLKKYGVEGESSTNINGNLKLNFINPSILSKVYQQIYGQMSSTDKNFTGVYGNVMVSLSTPRNMRWKEKTGALALAVKAVESFVSEVNRHITKFMGDKTRNRMEWIYEQLDALRDDDMEKMKITRMFNRVMNGWMQIEDGIIKINARRGFVKDPNDPKYLGVEDKETGKPAYIFDKANGLWTYASTGDPVYSFQKLIPLSEYVKGKHLNKTQREQLEEGNTIDPEVRFVIEARELILEDKLSKAEIQEIVDLSKKARSIHKKVFKYIVLEFKKVEQDLRLELGLWIKQLKRKEIIDAFLTGDFNKKKNGKYLIPKKEDRERGKFLYEKFGKSTVLNPFFTGTVNLQENPDSFPVIYQDEMLRFHYDKMLREISDRLDQLREEYNNVDPLKQQALAEQIEKEETNKLRLEVTRDRLDEAAEDPVYGRKVHSSRDAKSLKHITNSIDIRNMRDDQSVYYDYLRNMFSTLERAQLARKMITSIRTADPKFEGKNNLIKDYIFGLYDTVLHKPEARASVFGVDLSLNKIYKGFIRKLPFEIDEYKLDRYVRTLSAGITARYLGRMSTAILNKTATVQKIIHVGWKRYREAQSKIDQKALGPAIESLVLKSGILDFGDFFSKGLVQDLSQRDNISLEESMKITKAMFQYYADIKAGMKPKDAIKKFEKEANIRAKYIPGIKKLDKDINAEVDPVIKARLRSLREKKVKKVVDRWANWAITKDYVAYPMQNVSEIGLRRLIELSSKGFEAFNKGLYSGNLKELLTMSGTEKELRTHSFVIGVDLAINAGVISKDFWNLLRRREKLQGSELQRLKDDTIKALEVGREYTRVLDFGLSNQDTGELSRLGGGIMTKFTIWSQQRFGYDVRLFRDAYRSMKIKDGSAIGNTMLELIKSMGQGSKAWEKNPDIARLRNFVLLQGPLTLFMDLVLFGPFLSMGLRRYTPTKIMSGMSSDLISLTTSLPIYLIMAALGDEDEEDIQRNIFYKIRKIPFLGYGFGYSSDLMFWLLGLASDVEEEENIRRASKLVTPFIPAPPPIVHGVEAVGKEFLP